MRRRGRRRRLAGLLLGFGQYFTVSFGLPGEISGDFPRGFPSAPHAVLGEYGVAGLRLGFGRTSL